MAQNPLAISDVDNEVLREADEYLRKHKILELFEDLTTILAYKQPEQLENFLVDILKQRKMNGNRSIVYSDTELQNIFALYDLKGAGFITKEQCREGKLTKILILTIFFVFLALKTLANSEFHYQKAQEVPMPDKVDLFGFMKLCDDALGIKP